MKSKPAKGLDMLIALGGPKKAPEGDEPDSTDDSDDGGLPLGFEAAWKEYQDNPSAQSFYDAIEACKS